MPRIKFYGAFRIKAKAQEVAKAKSAKVHEIKVNGETRYSVYSR
jgi:hypothetical protein